MRSMVDMDTVQIEVTNACVRQCANCTRLVGHHRKSYFMNMTEFKDAVDSMKGYPKMVGIQGGEPLLHPDFEEMCDYLRVRFPKRQLGLWTTLPIRFKSYAKTICDTFDHIFVNDHTRDDIYHHPGLVAIREVIPDRDLMFTYIDRCWAQQSWSASINPHGAFFCEIAASLSMMFPQLDGWAVDKGWWWRTPKDFTSQIEKYCPMCGFAAPLQRRCSNDKVDDISQGNLDLLLPLSPRLQRGEYVVHDLSTCDDPLPLAAYKDTHYRNRISIPFGIYQTINDMRFWKPNLCDGTNVPIRDAASIYDILKEKYK